MNEILIESSDALNDVKKAITTLDKYVGTTLLVQAKENKIRFMSGLTNAGIVGEITISTNSNIKINSDSPNKFAFPSDKFKKGLKNFKLNDGDVLVIDIREDKTILSDSSNKVQFRNRDYEKEHKTKGIVGELEKKGIKTTEGPLLNECKIKKSIFNNSLKTLSLYGKDRTTDFYIKDSELIFKVDKKGNFTKSTIEKEKFEQFDVEKEYKGMLAVKLLKKAVSNMKNEFITFKIGNERTSSPIVLIEETENITYKSSIAPRERED